MKGIEALREQVKIQCSNGNWNYDPYMHGMANGLICALATMEDKEPEYLDAPVLWLRDMDVCIFTDCQYKGTRGCRVHNLEVYGIQKCCKYKTKPTMRKCLSCGGFCIEDICPQCHNRTA